MFKKIHLLLFLVLLAFQSVYSEPLIAGRGGHPNSVEGKYKVVYKNGASQILRGTLSYHSGKDYFNYYKYEVTPSQTLYIAKMSGNREVERGIPSADSAVWLFPTIKGKITVFSVLPNRHGRMDYIKKAEIIVPFTPEALLEMVKDKNAVYQKYSRIQERKHKRQALQKKPGIILAEVFGLLLLSAIGSGASATPAGSELDLATIGVGIIVLTVILASPTSKTIVKRYNSSI